MNTCPTCGGQGFLKQTTFQLTDRRWPHGRKVVVLVDGIERPFSPGSAGVLGMFALGPVRLSDVAGKKSCALQVISRARQEISPYVGAVNPVACTAGQTYELAPGIKVEAISSAGVLNR